MLEQINSLDELEELKMLEQINSLDEHEKELLRSKLIEDEQKPFVGESITFFFPTQTELVPVEFCGTVPRKGEVIIMENLALPSDINFSFVNRRRWIVDSVYRKYYVGQDQLHRIMYETKCRVEVHLVSSE